MKGQEFMRKVFPSFGKRSHQLEIIDRGDCTDRELAEAYEDLRRVNRLLGGSAAILRPLSKWILSHGSDYVSILDVGTGAGDIPRSLLSWGRSHRCKIRVVALDCSDQALRASQETLHDFPEGHLVRADAQKLPFLDHSFDFVISSMFFHHLTDEEAAELLRRFDRIGRVGFVVNDLHRHPVAYYVFWILSRLFSHSRLVRQDGLTSILRGFKPRDFDRLRRLSGLRSLAVRRYFPYRLVLMGPQTHS